MLSASSVRFQRCARISRPMPRSRSFGVRWGTRTRYGRGTREGGPWTHGALQHRSACLLTAHRPVNAAREVREAAERHAAGAGRVRAAHVHHVAPHLVADECPRLCHVIPPTWTVYRRRIVMLMACAKCEKRQNSVERRAAGAGRVRAAHVHHVAPHLVADDAQDCAT